MSSSIEPFASFTVVLRTLWSRLLTGVLIAVPLIVTFWVLSLAYSFISEISAPLWKTLGVTTEDPQFVIRESVFAPTY